MGQKLEERTGDEWTIIASTCAGIVSATGFMAMKNPVERMNMVVKGEPERMRTGECMPKEDRDDCTSIVKRVL